MKDTTTIPYKIYLEENEMPKSWYNLRADMKNKPAPLMHPGTHEAMTAADLAPVFCEELVQQELDDTTPLIEIPQEIRDFYKMYRPSPLVRAYCLEEKLQTPAKIYYKFEGNNTSGSHKLNSAIAQAYYAKKQGLKGVTTETGAGQWGTALSMACSYFGLDAVFIEGRLGLETDDGLVQKDLIEYGAEHIAVAGIRDCDFHCFGDRAAERTGRAGVLSEDLAAYICSVGRRRSDGSSVGAHDFAAERLLFVTHLDHEDFAVEVKIGTSHGQCCAPLAGTGLGGDAFEPLLLGVISLRDRGVELVASAGVVALELVVDVCRGLQLLLKAVSADQR